MKNFTEVYAQLRRRSLKQYGLLTGCCFFSVLLITAYACMMRSPTILNVLPEGGDSRKQVMMIFVLAVIGCAVFSLYAANLFFRYKSRETGAPTDVAPAHADPGMGYIFEHTRGRKCLIFSNSREEAEEVCTTLRAYCEFNGEPDRFLIHHGNLSAAIRESAEEQISHLLTFLIFLLVGDGLHYLRFYLLAQFGVVFKQRLGGVAALGELASLV